MIVITGAAGFIGSCLAGFLNNKGIEDLLLVDDFQRVDKLQNLLYKTYRLKIERDDFLEWFQAHAHEVSFMFHLGARTDTTEKNPEVFQRLNIDYSKMIWSICSEHNIPLIYASSAATYGLGEYGFDDDEERISHLKPLNAYGDSKQVFDLWAINNTTMPPFWAGLKFFNVYGPNEYHKGRMASVVYHGYLQVKKNRKMKLFRSHHPDFEDGKQLRDFIYIKDVLEVCYFMYTQKPASGIYNVGSGKARTFLDLANSIFTALGQTPKIEFMDTPQDIRDKYQYFTEANISKLQNAGFSSSFHSIEEGVKDYVISYLESQMHY